MQSYAIEELLKLVDIQRLQPLVVDVGASDGYYNSNSYDLIASYGWDGILFEPQDEILEKAKEYHATRLDKICLQPCAISEHEGTVVLFGHKNDGDGTKTLNHGASLLKTNANPMVRPAASMSYKTFVSIIDLSGVGVLSIDTEGYDSNILQGIFTITDKRPDVIITERFYPYGSKKLHVKTVLLEQDYNCVYDGIDQIYVRKDIPLRTVSNAMTIRTE